MAFRESSGFVRPYGRRAIAKLATVIRAAAGFRIQRNGGRRRAPPAAHLSAHIRRDIGLDQL
jgi:hypothetical protein